MGLSWKGFGGQGSKGLAKVSPLLHASCNACNSKGLAAAAAAASKVLAAVAAAIKGLAAGASSPLLAAASWSSMGSSFTRGSILRQEYH